MRPVLRVAALLLAVPLSFSLSAGAETVDFSLTGVDDTSTPYTATFALDPATYFAGAGTFAYENVAVTTNGYTETLDIAVVPDGSFERLSLFGSQILPSYLLSSVGGVLPLAGDPSTGLPPTVTPGTYGATVQCISRLTMPERAPGVMATLGLLQMPALTLSCGDVATLAVTAPLVTPPPPPPTSVTPEPATIGLLGTGALGLLGVVRRRFQ